MATIERMIQDYCSTYNDIRDWLRREKSANDKAALVEDVRRLFRASLGCRAKESVLVDFVNQTNLDTIQDKACIIDVFSTV